MCSQVLIAQALPDQEATRCVCPHREVLWSNGSDFQFKGCVAMTSPQRRVDFGYWTGELRESDRAK